MSPRSRVDVDIHEKRTPSPQLRVSRVSLLVVAAQAHIQLSKAAAEFAKLSEYLSPYNGGVGGAGGGSDLVDAVGGGVSGGGQAERDATPHTSTRAHDVARMSSGGGGGGGSSGVFGAFDSGGSGGGGSTRERRLSGPEPPRPLDNSSEALQCKAVVSNCVLHGKEMLEAMAREQVSLLTQSRDQT